MKEAIFDNTTFNLIAKIKGNDIISLCRNVFEKIYVPLEIQIEISNFPKHNEPNIEVSVKMERYLQAIAENNFLISCNTYDWFVKDELTKIKNIDKGEAEIISQAMKRNLRLIFTDDINFIDALPLSYKSALKLRPTYFLFFLLDIQGFIDYKLLMKEYFTIKPPPQKRKKFNIEFRENYKEALMFYGMDATKKEINEKTSISQFLV